MEPIQKVDYKSSPYHRPNQDWVCGRSTEGKPCALGPDARGKCGAGPECRPRRNGDRWQCTRSELHGGRCATGPLPDGTCACITPPCRPRSSVRALRRRATRLVLAVALGFLLLGLGSERVERVVSPGHLTLAHAAIGECSQCHNAPHKKPSSWLAAAFGQFDDVEGRSKCLNCHVVGAEGAAAHGLAAEDLPEPSVDPLAKGPWAVEAANRVFRPAEDALSCTNCHVEHAGQRENLRAVSNDRCQVCHSVRFANLANGHPEFDAYPYHRRTRINFDHASHIGKHFTKEADVAPESCAACHVTDVNDRAMLVRSFDTMCADCHSADVNGEKLAGAKGAAVIEVPGVDLPVLMERGVAIGVWPEFAEAPVSPLTDLLLVSDPAYRDAREKLGEIDLLDLEGAPDADLEAVAAMAWAFKRLMREFDARGPAALFARLDAGLAEEDGVLTLARQRELAGRLSTAVIESAVARWFPGLDGELTALDNGEPPITGKVRAPAASSAGDESAPPPAADDTEGFDDLFGGGLFGEDEGGGEAEQAQPAAATPPEADVDDEAFDDLFGGGLFSETDSTDDTATAGAPPEEPETSEQASAPAPMTTEQRMSLGGWYLEDFALRYRPAGHADAFLHAWLDLAASHAALEPWLDDDKPGACTKCHGISIENGVQRIDWEPKRPIEDQSQFTSFAHTKHFSMAGDKGCQKCHVLAADADYEAAFEQRDPMQFASNFAPMARNTCAACHTARLAGDDCVLCHRYHVGTLTATLPTASMKTAGEAVDGGE